MYINSYDSLLFSRFFLFFSNSRLILISLSCRIFDGFSKYLLSRSSFTIPCFLVLRMNLLISFSTASSLPLDLTVSLVTLLLISVSSYLLWRCQVLLAPPNRLLISTPASFGSTPPRGSPCLVSAVSGAAVVPSNKSTPP